MFFLVETILFNFAMCIALVCIFSVIVSFFVFDFIGTIVAIIAQIENFFQLTNENLS